MVWCEFACGSTISQLSRNDRSPSRHEDRVAFTTWRANVTLQSRPAGTAAPFWRGTAGRHGQGDRAALGGIQGPLVNRAAWTGSPRTG